LAVSLSFVAARVKIHEGYSPSSRTGCRANPARNSPSHKIDPSQSLQICLVWLFAGALLVFAGGGCCGPRPILGEYSQFNDTSRQIFPGEAIAYLKQTKFTNGELDHLPTLAIILHEANTGQFLKNAGYSTNEWTMLETGTTDPLELFVINATNGSRFIVERGLPGAGGISTQAAELSAMGVKSIVHIGTAAFLGGAIADSNIVISAGAYKDGGAVLLSDFENGKITPIARPQGPLTSKIESVLKGEGVRYQSALSYTIPVFYFQPTGLMEFLLHRSKRFQPGYLEMEEAPFFQTCQDMHVAAASLVVGSDRYQMSNGKLQHLWLGDTDPVLQAAFKAVVKSIQN
jgi:purine-nucleoside phosphorylase